MALIVDASPHVVPVDIGGGHGLADDPALHGVGGVVVDSDVADSVDRVVVLLNDDLLGGLGVPQELLVFEVLLLELVDSAVQNGNFLLEVLVINLVDSGGGLHLAVLSDLNLLVADDSILVGEEGVELGDLVLVLVDDAVVVNVVALDNLLDLNGPVPQTQQLFFEQLDPVQQFESLLLQQGHSLLVGSQFVGDDLLLLEVVVVLDDHFLLHEVLVLSEPPGLHLPQSVEVLPHPGVLLLEVFRDHVIPQLV